MGEGGDKELETEVKAAHGPQLLSLVLKFIQNFFQLLSKRGEDLL